MLTSIARRAYVAVTTLRARREARRHYSEFVRAGDLVFDIGANVGDRTAVFLSLGARVVAIEPQPACVDRLRRRFGGRITVAATALGPAEGEAEMLVSNADTVSTLSRDWVESAARTRRFGESVRWDARATVPVSTFDALIARHGVPAFAKIDVEGYEAEVLAGLTRALPCVSLEFVAERPGATEACVRRLESLGMRRFNLSLGESMALAGPWCPADELLARVAALPDPLAWGDLYVRE